MKPTFKKGDIVLIKKGLATYIEDESPLTVLEVGSGYCLLEDVYGDRDNINNRHITMLKAKRGRPFSKYGKYKKTLQKEALENAEQIKSWNKFGSTDFSYAYVFMAGIILGLAIACIVVTPSIIEAIK